MESWLYIVLSIALVIFLLAVFAVSFYLYRKTPAPKGCEGLEPDPEMCSNCREASCFFHKEEKKEK